MYTVKNAWTISVKKAAPKIRLPVEGESAVSTTAAGAELEAAEHRQLEPGPCSHSGGREGEGGRRGREGGRGRRGREREGEGVEGDREGGEGGSGGRQGGRRGRETGRRRERERERGWEKRRR